MKIQEGQVKSVSEESEKPAEVEGSDDKADDPGCGGDEFVIPGPLLPDGGRMCLHHGGDHTVRTGVMRPLEDGRPLDERAVLLEHREGTGLYNVVGPVSDLKKGPSKFNSPAFKLGWDNIFCRKPTVGEA